VVARVFVSYAREDIALARKVHSWLVAGRHEAFLDQDPRDGIVIGEQWRQRLHERLRWADAVVCLVTSAAVASSWCTAEVATAQSRGSRLLPLLVEPDLAHPLLTETQHIDMTQNPPAARAALIAALHRIDAAGGSGWPDDRSPFPGLRPFDSDRRRVFFGRANEIKQLAELVRSTREDAALLVVGPSGCGKSSLVRAGLVPMLAGEPGWRTLPPILPGANPVGTLAREVAAAGVRIGLEWTMDHVHHRLGENGFAELADELLLADPDGPQQRLLVVMDQFEELLTQATPSQRVQFTELLRPALSGPVRLVGTLRPEFLDQLLADPDLTTLSTETYLLRPLHREALRLVIEGPAQLAGLDVEAHLVARLIDDTDTGDALPLLAFTLAQLAEGICRGEQLSASRYDQLGGVQGALTRQADAALNAAIATGGRRRDEVIAGLLRLVTVDEQSRPTRWRVRRDELPAPVVADLDAFITRRLLATDADNGAVVIGVTHEAFLSAWFPLAEAITANVSALRARRAVEHAATEWHDHGRPPSRLWGSGQLAAAVADTGARICPGGIPSPRQSPFRWLPRRYRVLVTDRVDLSAQACDFLHFSICRDRSRRRRGISILSALLILALAAAGFAVIKQRTAQQGQRIATARQLLVQAEATRRTDLYTALLLGLAADRLNPDGETRSSLLNTLTAGPYVGTLTGHKAAIKSVAFAPDGDTLASSSADNTVILWDLTDRAHPRQLGQPLTGHTNSVNSVVFAPDRHTLAASGDDGTVILWDTTDLAQPHRLGQPLIGHTNSVKSVVWTPDGNTLATAADNTVVLWDLTNRAQPHPLGSPLTGYTGPVTSLAVAPDGHTLASSSSTSTTGILWDLTDRAHPHQLRTPLGNQFSPIDTVAFASQGHMLATSGAIGTTLLWDVTDQAQPYPLSPPLTDLASPVRVVAFSPNGRTLATGSDDGTVILWDTIDPVQPHRLGPPLTGHSSYVFSMAFAPDGRTLATGSFDKTVILWDTTDLTHPHRLGPPLTSHNAEVVSVAFAPDGRTLATAGADKSVILWDLTDRAHPRQLGQLLTGHTIFSVAFAPDGDTLATSSGDTTVILWDLTDRAHPRQLGQPLTGHTDRVWSIAFSPNGRTMATGSADSTAILWDLTNRTQPHQLTQLGRPFPGHTGTLTPMALTPDFHTLAIPSAGGTVNLWDLTDPAKPHRLGAPLMATIRVANTNNNHDVISLAFSPDGRTLAVGSYDVILWDLTDPTHPHRLGSSLANDIAASSVLFTPDGRTLAVASNDKIITLWDLTNLNTLRDQVVTRACSATHGGLTHAEWARYIPDLPYQATCPTS
jgi:WD40 repeat protein